MKELMRYMTIEERELYERLAKEYKIDGYSAPLSLVCHRAYSVSKDSLKRKSSGKKK